jgi:hypothetical protein
VRQSHGGVRGGLSLSLGGGAQRAVQVAFELGHLLRNRRFRLKASSLGSFNVVPPCVVRSQSVHIPAKRQTLPSHSNR